MAAPRAKAKAHSWQSRDCPPDFEVVFVEQGRLECETWYRTGRLTVNRWLTEKGKVKLLKLRAAYVKHQRQIRKAAAAAHTAKPEQRDRRKADPKLTTLAARFLQSPKGGNWAIYFLPCGWAVVGTGRRSPADVIDMAIRKGFDKRRAVEQIKAFAEQPI